MYPHIRVRHYRRIILGVFSLHHEIIVNQLFYVYSTLVIVTMTTAFAIRKSEEKLRVIKHKTSKNIS